MKLNAKKGFILVVAIALVGVFFLVGTESYFNSELLKSLNEGCNKNNGTVVMHTTFLNLDYSFSCN